MFTTNEARDAGLSSSTLSRLGQRGIVCPHGAGVYSVAGTPPTWHQRVSIAVHSAPDSIAIGPTAARLHRLDGFDDCTEIHVAMSRGARNRQADVVAGTLQSYAFGDVTSVEGIACSGTARTVCDLAASSSDHYERAADDFQRRGLSLQWLLQTAQRLAANGRSGPQAVIADVERRLTGGEVRGSWFERLVEQLLRSAAVPHVVRQFEVRGERGEFVARVDLAIPAARLAIEAHSRRFHVGPQREALDQSRENELAAMGWATMYVGWEAATRSPHVVARQIERVVARRVIDCGVSRAS